MNMALYKCCILLMSVVLSLQEIFDSLCELDSDGLSYVLEVSRNPTRLYDCMAQLLSHPLQRPLQCDVSHDIELAH